MDIGLTVVIVLVLLAVVAAVALLAVRARRRKQEQQRLEAAEHRHEAEISAASAQRREAEAAERAARAEHEQAQAREQAARARQDREVAEARHAAADRLDPDVDTRHRDSAASDPGARTDDLRVPADGSDHERDGRGEASEGRHDVGRDGQRPAGDARGTHADQDSEGRHEPGRNDGRDRTAAAAAAGTTRHDPLRTSESGAGEHPHPQASGADPAARTDDLRLGETRQRADRHRDDEHRDDQHRDDQHRDDQHRDDQHRDDQHRDDQHRDDQHPVPGRHGARADDAGGHVDPAARTDDLRPGQGWQGPAAAGDVTGAQQRSTGPTVHQPSGPRHRAGDRVEGHAGSAEGTADSAEPTGPGAAAAGSAPPPAVPAQRGGEHDREDQRESTDEGRHPGPVRALADRLLRRNG